MGLKEWHERASENWSVYMDRLEASVATPAQITPEFLKSAKKPDARVGIYNLGFVTGMLTMVACSAAIRGQIGLGVALAVVSCMPGLYHERRGKKILEQRAAQPPAPSADI